MKKAITFLTCITVSLLLASCSASPQGISNTALPSKVSFSMPSAEPVSTPGVSEKPSEPAPPAGTAVGYYITDSNGREGVIDAKGNIVLPAEFESVKILSYNGKALMFFTRDGTVHLKDGKTHSNGGFYKTDGSLILKADYKYASVLSDSLIFVLNEKGGCGAVSYTGKVSIPCKYTELFICNGKIIAATADKNYWSDTDHKQKTDVYDLKCNLLKSKNICLPYYETEEFSPEGYEFTDGKYLIISDKSGTKFGLADTDLNTVINPVWDVISPCGNGEYIVQSGDRHGLVDSSGKEIIPAGYYSLNVNAGDNAQMPITFSASDPDGAYIFDITGTQIFYTNKYSSAEEEDGMVIAIESAGKCHAVDTKGNDIIPPADEIRWDADCQLFICSNKTGTGGDLVYSYYTRDGANLPLSGFSFCTPVSPDRFIFSETQDSAYGICDNNGKIIVPASYSYIGQTYGPENILIFSRKDEYGVSRSGVMDLNGNIILPAVFDSIDTNDGLVFSAEEGPVSGLIDIKGNWLYHTSEYDSVMD